MTAKIPTTVNAVHRKNRFGTKNLTVEGLGREKRNFATFNQNKTQGQNLNKLYN